MSQCGGPRLEGGALASVRWTPYLPLSRAVGPLPTGADAAAVAHEVIDAVGEGTLLLDDLQWADSATLGLVKVLGANVATVVTVRADDAGSALALDALAAAGFDVVRLDRLRRTDAHDLVRAVQPGLSDDRVDDVLDRADGNPFLLLELAQGTSDNLHVVLAGAPRAAGSTAHTTRWLVWHCWAGLPSAELLGHGVDALLEVGLAVTIGDQIALRHDLIATEAIGLLDDERRRCLHLELAEQLPVGEAARHYSAGGDSSRARRAARAAAETSRLPGRACPTPAARCGMCRRRSDELRGVPGARRGAASGRCVPRGRRVG